jgi:hypothetical protein
VGLVRTQKFQLDMMSGVGRSSGILSGVEPDVLGKRIAHGAGRRVNWTSFSFFQPDTFVGELDL